jgi:hypothetical protein
MAKAKLLYSKTCAALEVAGRPAWRSFDDPNELEMVVLVDAPVDDGGPFWALIPGVEEDLEDISGDSIMHDMPEPAPLDNETEHEEGCECGDCEAESGWFAIDASMAEALIKAHLARWLLERGWQVQAAVLKEKRTWRLVDVLSFADGGGDRLEADYPHGEDELAVMCDAVVTVAGPR